MKPTLSLIALFVLFGCGPRLGETVKRDGQPDVTYVKSGDVEMNEAIETARSTLPEFRSVLEQQPAGCSGFSVKVAFPYGTEGAEEHIWLVEPRFSADTVSGIVNNEPVDVETIKLGQTVSLNTQAVSDWMYEREGALVGGYTIRVLLRRMTQSERAKTIAEMGLRVE